MDPAERRTSTRAVLLSAAGQNCWPPAGSYMAADTPATDSIEMAQAMQHRRPIARTPTAILVPNGMGTGQERRSDDPGAPPSTTLIGPRVGSGVTPLAASCAGCAATGVRWGVREGRRSRRSASCSATSARNGVRTWKLNSSATAISESRSRCRRDRRSTSRRICRGRCMRCRRC